MDRDVIAAIRQTHLKANIAEYERDRRLTVQWQKATVDPGGTIFGPGPYLKVPVVNRREALKGWYLEVRVYAPARVQRRLAKAWKGKAA